MAHLASTRQVAQSLEGCLATAFGPLGCDRFVRSLDNPGEVVITSSGDTVLQTLALCDNKAYFRAISGRF